MNLFRPKMKLELPSEHPWLEALADLYSPARGDRGVLLTAQFAGIRQQFRYGGLGSIEWEQSTFKTEWVTCGPPLREGLTIQAHILNTKDYRC